VRLYAGDAHEHLGRPAEAAEQYQAILDWNAQHPETLQGLHGKKVVERATIRLARVAGEYLDARIVDQDVESIES
jgi:hypothetical protein